MAGNVSTAGCGLSGWPPARLLTYLRSLQSQSIRSSTYFGTIIASALRNSSDTPFSVACAIMPLCQFTACMFDASALACQQKIPKTLLLNTDIIHVCAFRNFICNHPSNTSPMTSTMAAGGEPQDDDSSWPPGLQECKCMCAQNCY